MTALVKRSPWSVSQIAGQASNAGEKNWSCFLDLSNCTSLGSVTMHGSGIITGLPREREETVHRFSLAFGLWTRERSRENPFHHQS